MPPSSSAAACALTRAINLKSPTNAFAPLHGFRPPALLLCGRPIRAAIPAQALRRACQRGCACCFWVPAPSMGYCSPRFSRASRACFLFLHTRSGRVPAIYSGKPRNKSRVLLWFKLTTITRSRPIVNLRSQCAYTLLSLSAGTSGKSGGE
ncbi:hypothetical protein ES705_50733 [subsurface metagenome]